MVFCVASFMHAIEQYPNNVTCWSSVTVSVGFNRLLFYEKHKKLRTGFRRTVAACLVSNSGMKSTKSRSEQSHWYFRFIFAKWAGFLVAAYSGAAVSQTRWLAIIAADILIYTR